MFDDVWLCESTFPSASIQAGLSKYSAQQFLSDLCMTSNERIASGNVPVAFFEQVSCLANHHSTAGLLLCGSPKVSIPCCRQITFEKLSALKSSKYQCFSTCRCMCFVWFFYIFHYISISLAFFATTERPETTLRHPGPRFEDCSNCRKVYVDINAHAMKHIDDQNECFQVPVRMCQRMEPSWLWMSLQRWCPWGILGPQFRHVSTMPPTISNPTSDFDGYQGFRIVPELLMTKDLQGLEVKQLDCDILLSPKPLSLMGFWRSWHNLCG